jgi:ornithine cyclodeaminase/alanine dehydrogenase-like protein (mu-crystallin family)
MKVVQQEQIKEILKSIDLIPIIEQAFVTYSQGKIVTASISELIFKNPPGDVHIKSGYVLADDCYVIKIASGFYQNPSLGLPSSNGLMLVFSQRTGVLLAILLDQGYLTDVRTAVAGAIAAKYLAPTQVNKIGIIGCGTQARLQLLYLQSIIPCREVIVWGRSLNKMIDFQREMNEQGFSVQVTQTIAELTAHCQLIVTATNATAPLLWAEQIKPGTHITAIGADSADKQELDEAIFAKADIIAVDSKSQSVERGETHHALKKHKIAPTAIYELGNIIAGISQKRTTDQQITIADLTGLAAQDIAIAKTVLMSSCPPIRLS